MCTLFTVRGQFAKSRGGHSEQIAVLVLPGRVKIIGDVDVVTLIELDNLLDAVFVSVCFRHGDIGGEHQLIGE